MSIQAVSWALEQQDLPASAKLILVSIANHANHVDGYCWLRADTIARESSTTPRNVYRVVSALVRNGYLRKETKRGTDGKQRATDYWILFDRPTSKWSWFVATEEDDEAQDVVVADLPHDGMSSGESGPESSSCHTDRMTPGIQPYDRLDTRSIEEPSEEPSKPNKTQERDLGGIGQAGLRSYQPPPQPVVDEQTGELERRVFVIEGTPAWKAWDRHLRRSRGRGLSFSYKGSGEYVNKSGRHFPSLFPPHDPPTGPPETLMTADDMATDL